MTTGRPAAWLLVLLAATGSAWVWFGSGRGSSVVPDDGAEVGGPPLAERLEQDVRTLSQTIGERHLERPDALEQAIGWIVERLQADGWAVLRQEFDARGRTAVNLEVERRGTERPGEIVVVGAHYDTVVGSPGADDNATGVAALLELARRGRDRSSPRTVRYVFFANGEPPWHHTSDMGSLVYARASDAVGEDVVAMLSLESIGFFSREDDTQRVPDDIPGWVRWLLPDEGDFVAVLGNNASRNLAVDVLDVFRERGVRSEGGGFPEYMQGIGDSDQWAFWQTGYPAVVVTDTGGFRNDQYHRPGDLPDRLDYGTYAAVVAALDVVIERLARAGG